MKTQLLNFFRQQNYLYSFMLFSLFTHILAAIVSTGYHHADEHFQILEPLGWKLGLYGAQDLAWEFTEKIRPGLQIGIGYGVAKILMALGLYNPFTLTATLRQITGLLWWLLTWAFYKKWSVEFKQPFQVKALLLFSVILWFLPYLHVRYSSESWGGLAFFTGLYVCLYSDKGIVKKGMRYMVGGLLMGLSFYFRFQMGFAIIGFLGWLLWSKKLEWSSFFGLIIGAIVAVVIGTVADCWLYGEWLISPYNYFYQNIIAGKAAGFGTSPFYSYIPYFVKHAFFPIGILLLILLGIGAFASYKSPYTWVLVAFVLAHSTVAHKELRFMFPMVAILPYLLTKGLVEVIQWRKNTNPLVIKYGVRWFITINCVLMGLTMLKPASEQEALFKAFYLVHNKDKDVRIAFAEKDPFDNGLQMNFFRYCDDCFYKWGEEETIGKDIYMYTYEINNLPNDSRAFAKLKYSTAPIVAEALNFNNWQERTNHGYFWQVSFKEE